MNTIPDHLIRAVTNKLSPASISWIVDPIRHVKRVKIYNDSNYDSPPCDWYVFYFSVPLEEIFVISASEWKSCKVNAQYRNVLLGNPLNDLFPQRDKT